MTQLELDFYPRLLTPLVYEALQDSPAVLLTGARQTGKTTLAKTLVGASYPAQYFTFDDSINYASAQLDAAGFLAGLGTGPVILDEVQRVPELFPALKSAIDRDRKPGRFFLTGSANVLLLPKISESLAGRMEILTLWPLAQQEIAGAAEKQSALIDRLFDPEPIPAQTFTTMSRPDLLKRLLTGGFPEPLSRESSSRRRAWFRSYTTALLQRDVRDLSNIENLSALPRLLSLLASRAANLLNVSDISRSVDVPYATLTRYLTLLEATYLVRQLPAWSSNLGLRLIKSPKLLFTDTGLAASLLGLDAVRLQADTHLLGALLENFAVMECIKMGSWSQTQPEFFHFRTTARQEVDLVMENASGSLVGVEIKASATVGSSDFKGLNTLSELVGGTRFIRGIVLYSGEHIVSFGQNMIAVPLSALWEGLETVSKVPTGCLL